MKFKEVLEKIKVYAPLGVSLVIAACVVISLSGYQTYDFAVFVLCFSIHTFAGISCFYKQKRAPRIQHGFKAQPYCQQYYEEI